MNKINFTNLVESILSEANYGPNTMLGGRGPATPTSNTPTSPINVKIKLQNIKSLENEIPKLWPEFVRICKLVKLQAGEKPTKGQVAMKVGGSLLGGLGNAIGGLSDILGKF